MAETFKAVNVALGDTADAVVYTCPAATTAIVIHFKSLMLMAQMIQS